MFELNQVSKRYGDLPALDQLTLTLPSGRTTALIGPSGCGKSTLLRTLIGLVTPDAGNVRFAGEPLRPERLLELRRRMGYVIQSGGLFPHLTAFDNIALMARELGWAPTRINERVETLRTLTHFPADGLSRYPGELSGGQNQRVALMRALLLDPDVLLLDEPLGALDPMIRYDLQEELKQVFAALRKTVVLVTHDLAEAAFLGQDIILMRAGRVVQRGRLAEMLSTPAEPFVTAFIRAQRSHLAALEEAA